MTYLDELVARNVAEERRRDALLALRQREQEAQRTTHTTTVVGPRRHGRWHDALTHLHFRTRMP